MEYVAIGLFLKMVLLFFLLTSLAASKPVTMPMQDQYVANNSVYNVTYTCSVDMDSGSTVVWEVERSQIRNQQQFDSTSAIGIFIEPMHTRSNFSTISISSMARQNNNDSAIMIQCLASHGITSVEGERYQVITFNRPKPPGDLILEPALTLEWNRPASNIPGPENVAVNYTVMINSTDDSGMNFLNVTSMTSISVHFLEEILVAEGSQCVEFEFSVSATNDAGTGPPAILLDTVPISPDVTNINSGLRVEKVDLRTSAVDISFPPVQPCSPNFPLTNYTLNINTAVSRVLLPVDVVPGVPVTLLGLTRDNSFFLTVTACNDVTCRTSVPKTINTTDVQIVLVVFFNNHLFIYCSFADNSQAQGCIVRLTLSSTNETESFEMKRKSSSLCTTTNNQREAYSSVVVLDWEENGVVGNLSFDITTGVFAMSSLDEYIELTGCSESTQSMQQSQNSSAEVVGAVLGVLTVVLIIAVTITITVLFVLGWRKKKVEETADFATLTRKKKLVARGEKEHLVYGCDVPAGKECAKRIENDLSADTTAARKSWEVNLPMQPLKEEDNQHAWIEGHDDPNQSLTINVRWKPLVQALIDSKSLKPGTKPLLPAGKVQWQLHMDN